VRIDWKARFGNKTTLAAIATTTVVFAYQALAAFCIATTVDQKYVISLAGISMTLFMALEIATNPTTSSVSGKNDEWSGNKG